jgi:hypothetical protein
MKSFFTRFVADEDNQSEEFHMGTTIALILLFLLFIGSGFYLAVTNYS